jgi:hypothetical protein
MEKGTLSLAGEFAVASELCRRGIYAQLTLGLRKRTDLLVETETVMLRIQVKAKQGRNWPGCKGVFGENIMLVLVDYANKTLNQRPDFYILTPNDWGNFVKSWLSDDISEGKCYLDKDNCPIFPSKMKQKKPYEGVNVPPTQITQHKERWDKIEALCLKEL